MGSPPPFSAFAKLQYERKFTNQVRAYTTGTPWDCVYSIWSWTNVPEVALFQQGYRSYLGAAATKVELPAGFWNEPLVVRQALFFKSSANICPLKFWTAN